MQRNRPQQFPLAATFSEKELTEKSAFLATKN